MIGYIDSISSIEICSYTEQVLNNKNKLKNHPTTVTSEDIFKMYNDSLKI
jgi:hypothetical protein